MDLANLQTVQNLLRRHGIALKKSLGQNFLIDPTVCPRMAESCADGQTGVLEIGPGFGVLTAACAEVANRVVAVELDRRMEPVLKETLADYQNVRVHFSDVMKTDLAALIREEFSGCSRVVVCANLPYYITSPILMRLLESRLSVESLTVMVQKEAADRLCAAPGTRAAGSISAAVSYYAEPQILFGVGRSAFVPPPKVDSAVIRLTLRKTPAVTVRSEAFFFETVRACFAERRKTLLNSVSHTLGIDKPVVAAAIRQLGCPETVRGETLNLEQLARLSDLLYEQRKNG